MTYAITNITSTHTISSVPLGINADSGIITLDCYCTNCYNQKTSTCTLTYNKDKHSSKPVCYVSDTYKKNEAYNTNKIKSRDQGCLGGSSDLNINFHCGRSKGETYYDNNTGDEYIEYIYCCNENFCNLNATSIIPETYFSSTSPITPGDSLHNSGHLEKLILPAVIIPLLCSFLFIIVLLLLLFSWRHKKSNNKINSNGIKRAKSSRQQYNSGMRVMSGTIQTELYPLSSLMSGDTTISSSATGIPLLELRTIGRQIHLTHVIGKGRFGTVHLGKDLTYLLIKIVSTR